VTTALMRLLMIAAK